MSPRPFLLGEWRVEPSLNQLTRGSASQRITPKAMEVLVLLADRTGEAVTREEILERVWMDVHVQEEVLTRAISDLRKALDDDRRQPRYIETIPKRGYRIIAEVTPLAASAASAAKRGRGRLVLAGVVLLPVLALVVLGLRAPHRPEPFVLDTRPFTTFPGREIHPALSPGGDRVAFAWEGEGGADWDLHVKWIEGDRVLRLTEGPGIDLAPAWSPDGKRIAFARYSMTGGECRILEVGALGGGEREVGSCGKSQNPDLTWSPDGKWLAFSDRDSEAESFGIYLLSVETGERRKLVSPGGQHWGDKDPAFSPEGDWVAFTRSVSMSTQDIYRIPTSGGEPERVTFDAREIRGFTYTPEGEALIASSARSGPLALWRVPFGGTPERLVSTGGSARAPALSGGELVFEERWRDGDVVAARLEDSSLAADPLIVSTREDREPALSPDGERIAFVSDRSGSPEIWVSDHSGADATRLTDFGGPAVGAPSWSLDSRMIAFDARPEGNADVYLAYPGNGAARPLVASKDNELAPGFFPDGKHLFFGSDRGGKWQIWKVRIEDGRAGEAAPVTRNGGYAARVSPDGRYLYFSKFDSPGLHRLELSTGVETSLPGTEALVDGVSFCLDGDAILFAGFDREGGHLFRAGPEGGVAKLGSVELDPGGGLAFDRARGRVLFTRLARSESDLVIARWPES